MKAINVKLSVAYVILLVVYSVCAAQGETGSDEILPVSAELCGVMHKTKVLDASSPVGCERLRYVKFSYVNFSHQLQGDGELVVLDVAADHVVNIFRTLRQISFPLSKARLMNYYLGNDEASMADNNTSAFNDREIVCGRAKSIHAYGLAVDINPIQNPYIKRTKAGRTISPKSGVEYENRGNLRPGMAEAVIDIFAEDGFPIWGGRWSNPTDYQHFQVSRTLAHELIRQPPTAAKKLFESAVDQYRICIRRLETAADKKACVIGPP